MRARLLFPFLIAILITLGLYWLTEFPLGIPDEWTWHRIPFSGPALFLSGLSSLIIFAVYLLAVLLGLSRIPDCPRWELSVWLSGLVVAGMIWSLSLQDSPPAEYSLAKSPFVLYYKGSSGYFTEAKTTIKNLPDYLAGYETKMEAGDVLHEGTHPPGLPLFYWTLIRLCENSPQLQSFLQETQPASFSSASDIIAETTVASPHPLSRQDRSVLWLATLLTLVMSALTVIPLYLLAREFTSRAVSWKMVAFWPLIPAALIFQPKSDALYSVLSVLFLFSWVTAWRRNSALCFLIAGLLIWSGLFLTLAFLPVALCAVLYSLLSAWQMRKVSEDGQLPWKRLCGSALWSLCGFGIPLILLGLFLHINLPKVWILNLQNHAGFYLEYPRTYWKWLLLNPLEISLALGLPLTWLVLKSFTQRGTLVSADKDESPDNLKAFLLSCVIVLGLLWLSGKNMGEAARLWIIFLPWLLLMTIPFWQLHQREIEASSATASSFLTLQATWIGALIAQAVVCVTTINRVTGFHFPPG